MQPGDGVVFEGDRLSGAEQGGRVYHVRQNGWQLQEPVDSGIVELSFDRAARRASVRGAALELSPREWLLLDLLLTEQDRVVSKQQITQAWAQDGGEAGGGSIEVYIHRLRRKLEDSGLGIRTVRGLGYLLEDV